MGSKTGERWIGVTQSSPPLLILFRDSIPRNPKIILSGDVKPPFPPYLCTENIPPTNKRQLI